VDGLSDEALLASLRTGPDRQVYEAMQALSESDRQLLELIAVDGLSPSAAAATLGISAIAARVRLVRARGRLQAAMRLTGRPFPNRHTVNEEAPA